MTNNGSLIDILETIQGTLNPIAEQDWHGKWRILAALSQMEKATTIIRQHQADAVCPYVVTDGVSSYCRLAEQNGLPSTDQDTMETVALKIFELTNTEKPKDWNDAIHAAIKIFRKELISDTQLRAYSDMGDAAIRKDVGRIGTTAATSANSESASPTIFSGYPVNRPKPWDREYQHRGDCNGHLPECSCVRSGEISVVDIEAAIKNAKPERVIVRKELRQRTGEPIEVLNERIEFRVTPLQQATAVLELIRPYLRSPVMSKVRLIDCVSAIDAVAKENWHGSITYDSFVFAKAVLDKAGVPYVD